MVDVGVTGVDVGLGVLVGLSVLTGCALLIGCGVGVSEATMEVGLDEPEIVWHPAKV